MKKVNLAEFFQQDHGSRNPETVIIRSDEITLIPFTLEGVEVEVHYCEEEDLSGYVHCNGEDCVLCTVGRKPARRVLMPVYLPVSRGIGILPVTPSLRPHALLPQLGEILTSDKRLGVFVSRDNRYRYSVSSFELKEDMDTGEDVINRFKEEYEQGQIDLTCIYPRLSNEQLSRVVEIARILKLKGLKVNDGDQAA